MHTITLSFATLTELSAAVTKLTATGIVPAPALPTIEAPAPAPKPKAEKTAAAKPDAAAPAEPAPTPAHSPKPAAAAPAPAAEKAIEYPVLQKAVFELSALVQKKGLDAAEYVLSIAKGHGAQNFKTLEPGTYAAALADVKAKLVEVAALEEAVA